MKKITILLSVLFILASCGVKQEIGKTDGKKLVSSTEKTTEKNSEENADVILKEDSVSFSELEKNLKRLKNTNISNEDLSMLNSQFISYFNDNIQRHAIEKSDASICEKSDKDYIESCKKAVFVKIGKIENCDSFADKWLKNDCKNEILNTEAQEKLDENICDKLVFENEVITEGEENNVEKEENPEIIYCKNRVLTAKATKNLDLNICNKMSNPDKDMCIEEVKMEKENKKMQEEIKKQEELMRAEQEKNNISENTENDIKTEINTKNNGVMGGSGYIENSMSF